MLEAPRGLSHPQTSFIGTVCQGIHHTPFRAAHAPKNPNDSFKRQTTNHHTVKNDHKTIDLETRLIQKRRAWRNRDKANDETEFIALLASTIQFSNHHAPRPDPTRGPQGRRRPARGIRKTARDQVAGGGPGTQKHTHTAPRRPQGPAKPTISSTPARPHANREPSPTHGPHDGRQTIVLKKLRRKEVIQPHLPVRLPCYDLVPITSLTLDGSIQKRLGHRLRVLPTFMT